MPRGRVLLLSILAGVGCSSTLHLTPDNRWRSVVALQVPDVLREYELRAAHDAARPGCDPLREPLSTQLRIVQLETFRDYDALPERREEAAPAGSGIPLDYRDSGPLDLTLLGGRRLVPLMTGKELLARTKDRCTTLVVRERKRRVKPKAR